jgi:ubiquinone/menaquinone biosynthesis C-methylase UbiE
VSRQLLHPGGYNPADFDLLARVEEEHFWFAARRLLIGKLSGKMATRFGVGLQVLEVGCGTGNILSVFEVILSASNGAGNGLLS